MHTLWFNFNLKTHCCCTISQETKHRKYVHTHLYIYLQIFVVFLLFMTTKYGFLTGHKRAVLFTFHWRCNCFLEHIIPFLPPFISSTLVNEFVSPKLIRAEINFHLSVTWNINEADCFSFILLTKKNWIQSFYFHFYLLVNNTNGIWEGLVRY